VQGPRPFHHHTHQSAVRMKMYIEGMCADEVDECILISGQALLCIGPGDAFDSPSGCPQWEVSRVGTSATPAPGHLGGARNCWGTQARSSSAPKPAAEAMPSSRGDARAAKRARAGGAKTAP
jgi:hypothetical protein